MPNCIVCLSPFDIGAVSSQLCPVCLKQTLQETAHCQDCRAPLKLSSPYCQECNHRHGMSNCGLCNYELFKHAAVVVARRFAVPADPEDKLATRLWRWIRRPKVTRIDYYHLHCTQTCPAVMEGGGVLQSPDQLLSESIVSAAAHSVATQPSAQREEHAIAGPDLSQLDSPVLMPSASDDDPSSLRSEALHRDSSTSYQSHDPKKLEPPLTRTGFIQDYKDGHRDFSRLDLSHTVQENESLVGVDLTEANLTGSHWTCVNLAQATLSGANLDHTRCRETNFKGANLRNVSLQTSQIFLSDFCSADLSEADMRHSDFYASYFQRAYLTQANLADTKLDAADFSWADLSQANLEDASLIEAILEGTSLENARLISSNFTWANLQNACLVGANLSHANFKNSEIKGADFSYAQLINTDLSKTNLIEASSLREAYYSEDTQFPTDFNPNEWEMIKVQ